MREATAVRTGGRRRRIGPMDKPKDVDSPPTETGADDPEVARLTCAECGCVVAPEVAVTLHTGERFCPSCHAELQAHLHAILEAQARDVNYAGALLGALAGGALGAVVWWQFTVLTHIAFGLIAVLIAFAVARGIHIMTGGKRNSALHAMAVSVSLLSWLAGIYLVNRSLILRSWGQTQGSAELPWFGGPDYFYRVIRANFGIMDVVFGAITVYQAWILTRPLRLSRRK